MFVVIFSLLLTCCVFTIKSWAAMITTKSSTILPLLGKVNQNFKVVLASGSPRRKELIALMGLPNFEVLVSNFEENLDQGLFASPKDYCLATAGKKVEAVVKSMPPATEKMLVIGADTIVEINGQILEKPRDEVDSHRMLSMMSGNDHYVHTAVIAYCNSQSVEDATKGNGIGDMKNTVSFVETTKVHFCELTEADIAAYIELGEGKDKAGSYGIQGMGGQMVQSVEGCYFNVMGLPIHRLSSSLAASFD